MIVYYRLFSLLRERGIQQSQLLKDKIVSNVTLQKLRENASVQTRTLNRICEYLHCELNDICEYREEK